MIELTRAEIEIAKSIGCLRRMASMKQGHKNAHGFDGSTAWDIDIEGAAAELAYCKYRGKYWGGCVNTYKGADVGSNVQIRSTTRPDGCLIVRDNDPDDHFFVLVVGRIPAFTVVGFIKGCDAKQKKWIRNPNGREACYFVPQDWLKRI